jgi:hypothetical protein
MSTQLDPPAILSDPDFLEDLIEEAKAGRNWAREYGQPIRANGCQKILDGLLTIRDHRYETARDSQRNPIVVGVTVSHADKQGTVEHVFREGNRYMLRLSGVEGVGEYYVRASETTMVPS